MNASRPIYWFTLLVLLVITPACSNQTTSEPQSAEGIDSATEMPVVLSATPSPTATANGFNEIHKTM